MKKFIFSTILLIFILSTVGCSKKEIYITAEDVSTNTMLVKRNGQLQVAIVEDFDKAYYKLSELEEFVKKEISSYNRIAGGEDVKIEELKLKDGKAVMLLGYTGMKHYASFNKVMAAYYTADTKDVALELPEQYVNAKNGSPVDRATAMKDDKLRVLVVYEPYDIIVDGSVKYYSNNATLGEDDIIHSADEGATVIIFKPAA
jgi:hypothetical protein